MINIYKFGFAPICLSVLLLSGCGDKESVGGALKEISSVVDKNKEKVEFERIKKENEENLVRDEELRNIALKRQEKEDSLRKIEAEKLEAERISNLDPYKNYTKIKITAKDVLLQEMIDNSLFEYEKIVDKIRTQFQKAKEEQNVPRKNNLNELNELLRDKELEYELKCKKINEKNIEECKFISFDKVELELKTRLLWNQIVEFKEKIEQSEKIELDKYNTLMKRNIEHLLSQERK